MSKSKTEGATSQKTEDNKWTPEQNEALKNATPEQAPTPAPEKVLNPKEIYAAEREKLISAWLQANTKYNDEFAKFVAKSEGALTQTDLMKLQLASYKASQDLEKHDANEQKRLIAVSIEAEKNARVAIVDTYKAAILATLAVTGKYPLEGRTPEQNAEINAVYENEKSIAETLRETLRSGNVKKELHIPMGVTGAKLAKSTNGTSANDELIDLMAAGKTNEEIEQMFPDRYRRTDKGLVHGTIRTARWKYNQSLKS